MRIRIPQLVEALTGHFTEQHAQLARTMLHGLELIKSALAELDAVIAEACRPWAHQLELLQTIPRVGPKVAHVILAETGGDMSRFPSAAHMASWAGLAPGIFESAGKRHQPEAQHGNKWLTTKLVEAAGSAGREKGKNYLSAQFAHLTAQHAWLASRRSNARAQPAVGHLT